MTKRLNQGSAFSLTTMALLGLGLLIIAFTGWFVWHAQNNAKSTYDKTTGSTKNITALKVESDPARIDVTGNPLCDSQKLKKLTPYDCTQNNTGITTVLTAQATVTINGQNYSFKTWDGCSESNADKKICKVKVGQGKTKTAKVSYEKTGNPSAQSPNASGQCLNTPPVHQNIGPDDKGYAGKGYSFCSISISGTSTLRLDTLVENNSTDSQRWSYVTCYNDSGIDESACVGDDGKTAKAGGKQIWVYTGHSVKINHDTILVITADNAKASICTENCVPHSSQNDYDRYDFDHWVVNKSGSSYQVEVHYRFGCDHTTSSCW